MKKVLMLLVILSLFLCSCSNNSSDTISVDDYTSLLNEIDKLNAQIESPENNLEHIEDGNMEEGNNTDKTESVPYDDVPEEYLTALEKVILYEDSLCLYLSKLRLYEKLISEPLNFSEDAAQYAIENYNGDYFFIAVEHAKQHNNLSNISKDVFYEYLVSSAKFTEEEAQYAIDNAGIDWQENALNRVKDYKDVLSIDEMRVKLTQLGFTEEEINYALDNLE